MDSRGFIIASSDPGRIGNFHAGAYQIIEDNLDSLEISDGEIWEGAVAGQNFPIRLDGQIIGVVGITGEAEETRKYGSIIRKMTEILVLGKSREEAMYRQRTERTLYLTDWMNSPDGDISDSFIEKGKKLGVNVTEPQRIIAAYPVYGEDIPAGEAERVIQTAAARSFPDSACVAISDFLTIICPEAPDGAISAGIETMAERALKSGVRVFWGVGPASRGYLNVHENFVCAQRALSVSKRKEQPNAVFYRDLGVELISDTVSTKTKEEFFRKILGKINEESLKETVNLLSLFYRENGTLKVTAAQLGIHPNTLEYRLNKIFEVTGYNPRRYDDACLFQIAISFFNESSRFGNFNQ